MGVVPNLCLVVLCAAVVAAWARAYCAGSRAGFRWLIPAGALGILAFAFSVASPDDDLVKQAFIPQSAASVRTIRAAKEAFVQPGHVASAFAIPAQPLPLLLSHAAESVAAAGELSHEDAPAAPVSNHSPPSDPHRT